MFTLFTNANFINDKILIIKLAQLILVCIDTIKSSTLNSLSSVARREWVTKH